MSERGSGLSRLRSMWFMLGAFLITAVGASIVLLFLDPERQDSGINEWLILTILVIAAAAALGLLHGRWFTRVPQDAATGVSVGIFIRIAIIELVWLTTFVFFFLGLVDAPVVIASIAASVALTLAFAAPTSRLISHLQYQLETIGAAVDLETELRRPIG